MRFGEAAEQVVHYSHSGLLVLQRSSVRQSRSWLPRELDDSSKRVSIGEGPCETVRQWRVAASQSCSLPTLGDRPAKTVAWCDHEQSPDTTRSSACRTGGSDHRLAAVAHRIGDTGADRTSGTAAVEEPRRHWPWILLGSPSDHVATAAGESARTLSGCQNNLDDPLMGAVGSRFGRNVPLTRTYREEPAQLLEPNPRLISRRLLTRDQFQPATTLNVLAAAWIQFEVHDWVSHGFVDDQPWMVPLDDDDPWPEQDMTIKRTAPDPTPDSWGPPTFVTQDSHWWDGSQIYGSTTGFANAIRGPRGRLLIDELGLPPAEAAQYVDLTRRGRQLLGGPGDPAFVVHARTQRDMRPARGRIPVSDRPGAVRQGTAGQRGVDGQDSHRRLDAGDHRSPHHRVRVARQLVRCPRGTVRPALRPHRHQCAAGTASRDRRPDCTASPTH